MPLKNNETEEIKETVVFKIESRSFLRKFKAKDGWGIIWIEVPKKVEVFALALKDDNEIQGLVGVRNDVDAHAAYLHWACTAPHNNKKKTNNPKYRGAGGHLFAIAADRSNAWGYEGAVHGFALNKKILNHYIEKLAPPNPYKNPPKSKLNLLELGRYARRVGKTVDKLTSEEIAQFKI